MWGSDEEPRVFGALYPLWYGPDTVRDRKRAVAAMRELADAGYAPAAFALGWAYFDGDSANRDYVAAFAQYAATAAADAQIAKRCSRLPHPWSEHLTYWRLLGEKAGICDAKGTLAGGVVPYLGAKAADS